MIHVFLEFYFGIGADPHGIVAEVLRNPIWPNRPNHSAIRCVTSGMTVIPVQSRVWVAGELYRQPFYSSPH
jgi:hypothetical protein